MASLYEQDYYSWTQSQCSLLKAHDLENLDISHLIEEIEYLGNSDKRSLMSQTKRLLVHLLKIKFQPEKQIDSSSWINSVSDAQDEIEDLLLDCPSLKHVLIMEFSECYKKAVRKASRETGLNFDTFPKECPWTLEELEILNS